MYFVFFANASLSALQVFGPKLPSTKILKPRSFKRACPHLMISEGSQPETLVEAIEIRLGRRGDPRDRAVTLRELIDSGLAKQLRSSPFDPNQGGPIDFSPPDVLDVVDVPPQPTGFTVAGAFSVINLTWDYPSYSNHNQTEIWSHTSNVLGSATIAGVSTGQTFIDPVGSGKTVYYWIRHVNTAGLTGPWNSTTGTVGQTATDVAHMLDVLTGAITSSELATALATPIGNLPANTQTEINTLTGRINDVNDIAAWAASTSYSVDDLVIHSSKRYRALQNHTSSNSNQPSGSTSDNAYWKYIGPDSTVTIEQMFLINARTEDDVDHLDGQYTVKIDANGQITKPLQPMVEVQANTTQTIATSGNTKVTICNI